MTFTPTKCVAQMLDFMRDNGRCATAAQLAAAVGIDSRQVNGKFRAAIRAGMVTVEKRYMPSRTNGQTDPVARAVFVLTDSPTPPERVRARLPTVEGVSVRRPKVPNSIFQAAQWAAQGATL